MRWRLTRPNYPVPAILQFEGILETPETDKEKFEESILAGVRDCLQLFKESRLREGEALKNVLLKYCGQIDALVDELEPKIPLILHTMKEKLVERLDEALTQTLSENSQISKEEINDRIRQEVTLYGIKIDVNERWSGFAPWCEKFAVFWTKAALSAADLTF